MPDPFIALQHLLPQHLLSRAAGRLADARQPRWLKNFAIRRFAAHYGVALEEAERPFAEAYGSFNDFFTRALKPGARPLCATGIACPADGVISQSGPIDGEQLLQAKGREYSLDALLAGDRVRVDQFTDGSFMTIYLSPRDYHRVHMPLDGQLRGSAYVPGKLFPLTRRRQRASRGYLPATSATSPILIRPAGPWP